MKKLLTVVVAVVVALVLSLYAVGSMQPVDHVASMRATYAAPPEEVWALMTDFEGYPAWNSMFPQVRRADDVDGKPCWVLEGEWGPMPSVVDLLEPPGRMVTRIAPDADIGFEGTWSYWLVPAEGGGCTLRIQEDGNLKAIPIPDEIKKALAEPGGLIEMEEDE